MHGDDLIDDEIEQPIDAWHVLVVDDDEMVHTATRFALSTFTHHGRPIKLHHAYSTEEVLAHFAEHDDIAVALIDVVMESEMAGLKLVDVIRNDIKNTRTRLILRTGQPGYAPEAEVVRRYDINDYLEKGELNFRRLTTSLISALRAYEQIDMLERHRDGLQALIKGLGEMFGRRAIRQLAEGVLYQLTSLLRVATEGVVCTAKGEGKNAEAMVLAAAGSLTSFVERPLRDLPVSRIGELVKRAMEERQTIVEPDAIVLYTVTPSGRDVCIYAAADHRSTDPTDLQLLRVFGHNVALAFENADLVERAETLAYVDTVTGLPTEARYLETVNQDLAAGRRDWTLLIDLMGFHAIVAAYGLEVGDAVLHAFGATLRDAMPTAHLIGKRRREFIVVLDGAADPWAAIQNLRQALAKTPNVEGTPIGAAQQIQVGVARAHDQSTAISLLGDAIVALFKATETRQDQVLFEPQMMNSMRDRLELATKLQETLRCNALSLNFQPLLDIKRRPLGAEALLRAPSELIQASTPQVIRAAEQSGLIIELGLWVLRAALSWQTTQRARGHELTININVSPTQLLYPTFRDDVQAIFDELKADPKMVMLEVTEEVFVEQDSPAVKVLGWFREKGCKVAIDDFGTGYSSLGYLSRMPVDIVKIDRSFVTSIEHSQRDRDVLESMIRIAKSHALEITAEGVETEGQYQILKSLGVDKLQGYLFGKPMPEKEFDTWLDQQG
jgi:diguanylate cyclase (GGDEF)-like protein